MISPFSDILYILQHLKQYPIRHTAGGIAVLLPSGLMHGDVGQHIYRCFEQIQIIVCAVPVKTMFWDTVWLIATVGRLCSSPTEAGVVGFAIIVLAYEHHIVIFGGFVNETVANEGIQHLLVDATAVQKVDIFSPFS